MFSKLFLFAAALPLAYAAPLTGRDTSSPSPFFAYGPGIGGVQLIYVDGVAYIGNAPSDAKDAQNMTVSFDYDKNMFTAHPVGGADWTDTKYLSIKPDAGAYDPVEIVNSAPDYIHTGAQLYGDVVFWWSSAGTMISQFYATPVEGTEGSWILRWNSDDSRDESSVAVALKDLPPSN
ncbi:hypothetical protein HDK77DRAFT_317509 [Phyllosticta capitalensis]|uniref:Uncharacterized protein n=1 Tax=Phyllosticta capitalensis TaxID=121624 RepID=A0ABR1YIG6_9PEZI